MSVSQSFQNPLKAQCAYHPYHTIMNFCKNSECLMPLCAECIQIHTAEHSRKGTYGQFVTIDVITKECIDNVTILQNKYKEDFFQLNQFNEKVNTYSNNLHQKLDKAKNKIQEIVEQFFLTLNRDLTNKQNLHKRAHEREIELALRKINEKNDACESFIKKLQGRSFLKHIITLMQSEFLVDTLNYHKEIDTFLKLIENQLIDVVVDESKLYSFNLELAKFITLKNAALFKINTNEQQNQSQIQNKIEQTSPSRIILNQNFQQESNRQIPEIMNFQQNFPLNFDQAQGQLNYLPQLIQQKGIQLNPLPDLPSYNQFNFSPARDRFLRESRLMPNQNCSQEWQQQKVKNKTTQKSKIFNDNDTINNFQNKAQKYDEALEQYQKIQPQQIYQIN